ncbi:MAG TPA: hypothetical protein DEB25_00665 [Desulfobulbaceae bacterium]|nr:hypothetical protein [Desulfobulbaceae bacterium]
MSDKQVFLSYASGNLEIARQVYAGLKQRGLRVWFDKEDLRPGPYKPQIKKAIVSSRYFVICISEAALKKTGDTSPGFQDEELNWAYDIAQAQPINSFAIIPARLEDCGRGDHRLSIQQQYDLFPDFETGLDKLALHLGGKSLADSSATDTRSEEEKAVDVLMNKAATAGLAGDYKKALALCCSATLVYPASAEAWLGKGMALNGCDNHRLALQAFDKAIELKPDFAAIWLLKAHTLSSLGRNKEAVEAFDKTIELNPDEAFFWTNKGLFLEYISCYGKAIEAYDKAIELKPDDVNTWARKGNALVSLRDWGKACESYEKVIELDPNNGMFWDIKGKILLRLGRDQEAIEAFSRARELGIKE